MSFVCYECTDDVFFYMLWMFKRRLLTSFVRYERLKDVFELLFYVMNLRTTSLVWWMFERRLLNFFCMLWMFKRRRLYLINVWKTSVELLLYVCECLKYVFCMLWICENDGFSTSLLRESTDLDEWVHWLFLFFCPIRLTTNWKSKHITLVTW